MKKLLLAALLGVQGLLAATAPAQVCDRDKVLKERAKNSLMGTLVHKIRLEPAVGTWECGRVVETWELHVGDKVYQLDISADLLAQARKLDGKFVHVSGVLTLNGLLVEQLDEVVAFIPLPTLPELDLKLPKMLPQTPMPNGTILFGTLADGPDGMTLTADGQTYRVAVLCGNDPVLDKARRLLKSRWGVQASGQVIGDTLFLTDVWPAAVC
jgi:hypothetical protein